jgi:uncharacterized membrane protein YfcA
VARFSEAHRAEAAPVYGAFRHGPVGVVIGFLSALAGIGGATLCVPYLVFNGHVMHRAVGSTSAIGVLIGVFGSASYMINGWSAQIDAPMMLGYVNGMAVLMLIPFTMMMAPVGAMCSHQLPVVILKRVFAVFMLMVAVKMGWF